MHVVLKLFLHSVLIHFCQSWKVDNSYINFENDVNPSSCLPDATPAEKRRSLRYGDTVFNFTAAIEGAGYWTSLEIVTRAAYILLREKVGVHVDLREIVDVSNAMLGLHGCKDYADYACENRTGKDEPPPMHFFVEHWDEPVYNSLLPSMLSDVDEAEIRELRNTLVYSDQGYIGVNSIALMSDEVKKAADSDVPLDLDWWKDLAKARGGGAFTSVNDLNIEWGVYQYCEHGDADRFREWGWTCDASLEYDNPWRDANGQWPTKLKPYYNCDEWENVGNKAVVEQYRRHGMECVGDGWWASKACLDLGDPLDNCIPHLSWDVTVPETPVMPLVKLGIPIITTKTSNWEVHEEMLYDYTVNQNNVILQWWEPDASFALIYYVKFNFLKLDTPLPSVPLKVVTWSPLRSTNPEIFKFATKFQVGSEHLQQMLADVTRKVVDEGMEDPNMAKDTVACEWVKANENIWSQWLLNPSDCPEGRYFNDSKCQRCPAGTAALSGVASIEECVPCQPGYFSTPGSASCSPCVPGSFQNDSAAAGCNDCPAGRFSDAAARTCEECAAGRFISKAKMSMCDVCTPGRFQNLTGQTQCDACGIGRFQEFEAAETCTACRGDQTTLQVDAPGVSHCVCRVEYYQLEDEDTHAGHHECILCTEGMICNEPNQKMPKQEAGYYLIQLADHSWEVSRCVSSRSCPFSNDPKHFRCADNFDTDVLNCAKCKDQFYLSNFECRLCDGGTSTAPVALLIIAFLLLMIAVYYAANSRLTKDASSLLVSGVAAGMLLTTVQSLSVIGQLSFEYEGVWKEIMLFLVVFAFDVEWLQTECISKSDSLSRYFFRVFFPGAIVLSFLVMMYLSRLPVLFRLLMGHTNDAPASPIFNPWVFPKVFNSICTLFQALYIAIVMVTLLPFQCYSNPNETSSMTSAPNVLCYTENHVPFQIAGAIFLIVYGIGFYAMCIYANFVAPSKSKDDDSFLIYFRFLVFRFRVDRWYWGSFLMLRAFLVALIPVLNPDDGNVQLVALTAVLSVALIAQCLIMPWKTTLLNVSDIMVLFMLIIILSASGTFVEAKASSKDGFTGLIVSSFAIAVLSIAITLVLGVERILYSWRRPGEQQKKKQVVGTEFGEHLSCSLLALTEVPKADVVFMAKDFSQTERDIVTSFLSLMGHELSIDLMSERPNSPMSPRNSLNSRLSVSHSDVRSESNKASKNTQDEKQGSGTGVVVDDDDNDDEDNVNNESSALEPKASANGRGAPSASSPQVQATSPQAADPGALQNRSTDVLPLPAALQVPQPETVSSALVASPSGTGRSPAQDLSLWQQHQWQMWWWSYYSQMHSMRSNFERSRSANSTPRQMPYTGSSSYPGTPRRMPWMVSPNDTPWVSQNSPQANSPYYPMQMMGQNVPPSGSDCPEHNRQ